MTVALANAMTTNGVAAGGTYCDTTGINHGEKQLREINVAANQMPGIA